MEEAEKTLVLMMEKDQILDTMGLVKRIMKQRAKLERERTGIGPCMSSKLQARPEDINLPEPISDELECLIQLRILKENFELLIVP